jgi:hypothetical protein
MLGLMVCGGAKAVAAFFVYLCIVAPSITTK